MTRGVDRAVNIAGLRRLAKRRLPAFSFDYVDGSAEDEISGADNRRAFDDAKIVPRQLTGISEADPSTSLFGKEWAFPLAIAPTGYNGLLWRKGDVVLARQAANSGLIFTQSTMSSSSVEDVAEAAPGLRHWFQLYVLKDREATRTLVERARQAGCEALVVTTDVAALGNRERDKRHFVRPQVLSLRARLDIARRFHWCLNVALPGLPDFGNLREFLPKGAGALDGATYIAREMQGALSWRDIEWLRDIWPHRLVVKGLLHPEEAADAVRLGADAIVVSNHGGRQLDGAPSPLRVLDQVRSRVGGDCALLMDSGVRRGSDILKALARGADGVLSGRAMLYGLAAGGPDGVNTAIDILRSEFVRAMILSGVGSTRDIDARILFDPDGFIPSTGFSSHKNVMALARAGRDL